MSDFGSPFDPPPEAALPPAGPRAPIWEILSFAAVFVAGGVVGAGAFASGGPPSRPAAGHAGGIAAPVASDENRADVSGPIVLGDARSNVKTTGCTVTLTFEWDRNPTGIGVTGQAVIDVTGPVLQGRYERPFTDAGVRLELTARVTRAGNAWKAILVSVAGRSVGPSPLDATFSDPTCAGSSGGGSSGGGTGSGSGSGSGGGRSPQPSDDPGDDPADDPEDYPDDEPTDEPDEEPTDEPDEEPTDEPDEEPTDEPTGPASETVAS